MNAHPLIIAHRGASSSAPENTLMSFLLAFMQGADGIEADLRLTADGHLVAVHDEDMKRTAGSPLRVSRVTLERLRELNAGRMKGRKPQGQKVPTLEEILAMLPEGKLLVLDIKSGPEAIPALAARLKQTSVALEQIRVASFDVQVLLAAKDALPKAPRLLLSERRWTDRKQCWLPETRMLQVAAKSVGAVGISLDARSLQDEPDTIALFAEAGLETHVWTINRAPNARRFAELGVASITTDYPGHLVESLSGELVE